ncbi:Rsd/AlgQ family anti-sigma factor [Plesiomonas shigelloides subsp. oncorhynchi]|nr:Rsd/AlgQ family anti-sigma factor [Plesiomonas shigelloides]
MSRNLALNVSAETDHAYQTCTRSRSHTGTGKTRSSQDHRSLATRTQSATDPLLPTGGLAPFHREKQALPTLEQITAFNARLVDYLSAGHFEIYDRIISQAEQHGASKLNLHPSLYPRLTANTQQLLHFHDCYTDISEDDDALLELDQNLSTLGELLEQRFALEDQLIKAVVLTTGQSF